MSAESENAETKKKLDVIPKKNPAKPENKSKTKNLHKVTKTIVTSSEIYKPVGPYSQAILADKKTLYVSGILGMDPQAQLICGGAEAQTRQALDNLKHVLEAGGASLESVVKTTILLARMDDFQVVNQVYAEYFPKDCPARATFQVGKLPLDAAVEIEAIALSGDLVVADAESWSRRSASSTYASAQLEAALLAINEGIYEGIYEASKTYGIPRFNYLKTVF